MRFRKKKREVKFFKSEKRDLNFVHKSWPGNAIQIWKSNRELVTGFPQLSPIFITLTSTTSVAKLLINLIRSTQFVAGASPSEYFRIICQSPISYV